MRLITLAVAALLVTEASAVNVSPVSKSIPFDRGAASAALSGVDVQSCKKAGGPVGAGKVNVTFAPSGSVESSVVEGAPYEGTAVGGCVAGKFRGARVPAFSGAPVSISKSFSIN
jgi:hypothetical protein